MPRNLEPDPKPSESRALHRLELRILMALLDGPNYGSRIVREIEARCEGESKLYPANLFRRIRDLLARGLIEECDGPEGVDPRRTYMRVTPEGRAAAQAAAEQLRELVREAVGRKLLPES